MRPAVISPTAQPASTGAPMHMAARAANGQRRPAGGNLNKGPRRNEGRGGGAGKVEGVELIRQIRNASVCIVFAARPVRCHKPRSLRSGPFGTMPLGLSDFTE